MMWPSRGRSCTTALPCPGWVRTRSLAGSGLVSLAVTRIKVGVSCSVVASGSSTASGRLVGDRDGGRGHRLLLLAVGFQGQRVGPGEGAGRDRDLRREDAGDLLVDAELLGAEGPGLAAGAGVALHRHLAVGW